jgi:hypothetical protein
VKRADQVKKDDAKLSQPVDKEDNGGERASLGDIRIYAPSKCTLPFRLVMSPNMAGIRAV